MADGEPDERATGVRVGMGGPLSRQVGEEEEAVAAGGDPRGPVHQLVEGGAGASASRSQRRLPAADSITPIMCHRPGTAWQKAWTRPPASIDGSSVVAKTTPEVPNDRATTPGTTAPTPTALADWSPPPATTGVPASSPVAAAASAETVPVTTGPSKVRGASERSMSRAASELRGPGAGRQVEQDGARAVGDVDRVVVGEPEADIVLGEQDVA